MKWGNFKYLWLVIRAQYLIDRFQDRCAIRPCFGLPVLDDLTCKGTQLVLFCLGRVHTDGALAQQLFFLSFNILVDTGKLGFFGLDPGGHDLTL